MLKMIAGKFCGECPHKSEDLQYKCCFQVKRNEEIQVYFVETADRDYIISRNLLKLGFKEEALYHISQALEKYLKSILLYDNCSVKTYEHRIKDLKRDVEKRLGINLDLTFSTGNNLFLFTKLYSSMLIVMG